MDVVFSTIYSVVPRECDGIVEVAVVRIVRVAVSDDVRGVPAAGGVISKAGKFRGSSSVIAPLRLIDRVHLTLIHPGSPECFVGRVRLQSRFDSCYERGPLTDAAKLRGYARVTSVIRQWQLPSNGRGEIVFMLFCFN